MYTWKVYTKEPMGELSVTVISYEFLENTGAWTFGPGMIIISSSPRDDLPPPSVAYKRKINSLITSSIILIRNLSTHLESNGVLVPRIYSSNGVDDPSLWVNGKFVSTVV